MTTTTPIASSRRRMWAAAVMATASLASFLGVAVTTGGTADAHTTNAAHTAVAKVARVTSRAHKVPAVTPATPAVTSTPTTPTTVSVPSNASGATTTVPSSRSTESTPVCSTTVSDVDFTVNGVHYQHLRGVIRQGAVVSASFVVPANCQATVRLSSFYEAQPRFGNPNTEQVLADRQGGTFVTGAGSVGPVTVPSCNFQLDFVQIIAGRSVTLEASNSGHVSCASPSVTGTSICPVSGTTASESITFTNGGPGSDTFSVKDGISNSVIDHVALAAGGSITRTYAVTKYPDTFTVTDDQTPQYSTTLSAGGNCTPPVVTASFSCKSSVNTASFIITSTAPSGAPADLIAITSNGKLLQQGQVPAGTTKVVSLAYNGKVTEFDVSGAPSLFYRFYSPKAAPCSVIPTTTTTSTTAPKSTTTTPTTAPPTTTPTNGTTATTAPVTSSNTIAQTGTTTTVPATTTTAPPVAAGTAGPATPTPSLGHALAFTGLNIRAFLTWVAVLLAFGALLVLLSASVRRNDPNQPLP